MRLLADLKPADPALGLAIEEVLLDSAREKGIETLRFWRNQRAVVLGRSQSLTAEVDEPLASHLGIPIIRRMSGGGAVYHYPGNLNVSVFATKRPMFSDVSSVFTLFGAIMTAALAALLIQIRAEDNGLYVEGLKVGGAAQAHRGSAVLYHTTLLVQPSSVPMESLLLAMRAGYRAQGVASRPRTTTTLSEQSSRSVELDELVALIACELATCLRVPIELGELSAEEMARAVELQAAKYGSPAWNAKH